jgi:hypothetical protein
LPGPGGAGEAPAGAGGAAQEAWEVAARYLTEVDGDLTQLRLGEANERPMARRL